MAWLSSSFSTSTFARTLPVAAPSATRQELAPLLQVAADTVSKLAKCARPLAEMEPALQIVSLMGPGQTQAHLPAWISRACESAWSVLHLLPEPQR